MLHAKGNVALFTVLATLNTLYFRHLKYTIHFVDYIPWTVNPAWPILRSMDAMLDLAKTALAENVRQKRAEQNLSQEGLAFAAEVDRTYVSQIERAISNPSLAILCRIAQVLGCSPCALIRRETEAAPESLRP
jgi:DNA-binding XRE family transcriptional regulator